MDKYRHGRLGTIVEAERLTMDNAEELAAMVPGAQIVQEIDPINGEHMPGLNIPTPEGMKRLSQGQYLVRYQGYYYVAAPSRFQTRYIRVDVPKGEVPKTVRDSKILRDGDEL